MEKKPFARIDFVNCGTDYDYTICTWENVSDYVDLVHDNADFDEEGYEIANERLYLPSVTVSVVMMTDYEFSEWFTKRVESHA